MDVLIRATPAHHRQWLPCNAAALMGCVPVIKLLLQAAPESAMLTSRDGSTAAHLAVGPRGAEALRELLAVAPVLASQGDDEGCPPACCAAAGGHIECLQALLAVAPASAVAGAANGWTAAHEAAVCGQAAALQVIVAAAPSTATATCDVAMATRPHTLQQTSAIQMLLTCCSLQPPPPQPAPTILAGPRCTGLP